MLGERLAIVVLMAAVLLGAVGCQQERRFAGWTWGRSGSKQKAPNDSSPARRGINSFVVHVFRSTGSQACLDQAWSYLDELLPGSVRNWEVIGQNGLRCGVGQVDAWEQVKAELEGCQTRTSRHDPPTYRYVGFMSPTVVRSDPVRNDRILFYRDLSGRLRGRPFGKSGLELVLTSPGRTGAGHTRVIFSPRIVLPRSAVRSAAPGRPRKGKSKTVKQELENLNIVVDLGPEEFVLLGPSSRSRSEHLVGSQLFTSWKDGQKNTYFVLVMTAPPEGRSGGKGKRKDERSGG